jgi:hypothetical protein
MITVNRGRPSRESLNINKVIRTLENDEKGLIVILDDFNERVTQQPDIDIKTNKMKGYKSVRETVQSEIELNPEDAQRFLELTEYK